MHMMLILLYFSKYSFFLSQLWFSAVNALRIYLNFTFVLFSTEKNTGTAKIRLPFLWLKKYPVTSDLYLDF